MLVFYIRSLPPQMYGKSRLLSPCPLSLAAHQCFNENEKHFLFGEKPLQFRGTGLRRA